MNRLALLAAPLALATCKKNVDGGDFAKFLKQRTVELGIPDADVTCPSGIEAKVGTKFECSVTVKGKSYGLIATITSVEEKKANMDTAWKDGEAVISAKLEPGLSGELSKTLGSDVKVTCGDALRFIDANRSVTCDVAAGPTKSKVITIFNEKLNPTSWKLEPPLMSTKKLADFLSSSVKEKHPNAKVDCGEVQLIQRPADGFVYCNGVDGTEKVKLKVEVDADLNVKRWDPVP